MFLSPISKSDLANTKVVQSNAVPLLGLDSLSAKALATSKHSLVRDIAVVLDALHNRGFVAP